MIEIIKIDIDNALYPLEQELRNEILLRPIGIPDHAWEMNDNRAWHFVATDDYKVIGCVVLVPQETNKNIAQLTQMAVASNQQGKGIGKKLVQELIRFSKKVGIQEINCHSRVNAIPFYLNLGFEVFGNPFWEVGMEHAHMKINL
jgi:predicted GNAT family N-acyltransferase